MNKDMRYKLAACERLEIQLAIQEIAFNLSIANVENDLSDISKLTEPVLENINAKMQAGFDEGFQLGLKTSVSGDSIIDMLANLVHGRMQANGQANSD